MCQIKCFSYCMKFIEFNLVVFSFHVFCFFPAILTANISRWPECLREQLSSPPPNLTPCFSDSICTLSMTDVVDSRVRDQGGCLYTWIMGVGQLVVGRRWTCWTNIPVDLSEMKRKRSAMTLVHRTEIWWMGHLFRSNTLKLGLHGGSTGFYHYWLAARIS